MTFKKILLACSGVAVLAGTASVPTHSAFAQASSNVNEIIVRVRQREETLRDVPGTVNVISQDTIKRAGVERAADFIELTPGVSLVNTAEVADTQVNIRGINSSRDAEQSFAFIIDGILLTNTAAFNREYTNLQQIEIFKGPQGAIYGRNAAAGAIIVTTETPDNEFDARMKTSYGFGDEAYLVTGSVSGPIIEDQLFFRLSGDYRNSDGFYMNTFLGTDDTVDDFEAHNIEGRLVWTPNDDLTVDLKARYGKVDGSSIIFNAAFALPAFAAVGGFEDVNEHDFLFVNNIDDTNNQKSLEISGKFDYDMDWATLTGWMLYSDNENDFLSDGTSGGFAFFAGEPNCIASAAAIGVFDASLFPPPTFNSGTPTPFLADPAGSFYGPYTPITCDGYQYQERFQEDLSFELRLTSPADQRLRWQGGFYFLDIDRRVGVATGVDPTFLGGTIIESFASPLTEAIVHDQFDSRVYAVFGNVQYDINDDVELSLALRYDSEKRKVDNLVSPIPSSTFIGGNLPSAFGMGPPFLLNPGLDPILNPLVLTTPDGSIPDDERTFEQIQPKVSLTWDVTDSTTLFASWGIGFKSGGFNNQGSAATIDFFINGLSGTNDLLGFGAFGGGFAPVLISDGFEKEKSSAFEWGFKTVLLDGMAAVEGAGYYTTVDDMQFFEFFVGPFGLLRVVNNIDEVTIWGGELALNVNPVDWLSLYVSGNITESKIKKMDSRPDTVGNKSPYTPDYTLNAGFQFVHPISDVGIDWVTRLDFQYVGPTWFHVVQSQMRPTIFSAFGGFPIFSDNSMARRDAYTTINLRFGFEAENWSLFAFANNLTDNDYIQEAIPAPEFGGAFIHPSDRRSWGVEANINF